MLKFDQNNIKDIDFTDIYVMETWLKKMIIEITELKKDLCYCKYKIMMAKWNAFIYWYMNTSLKIINYAITIDDILFSISNVILMYEKDIRSDKKIYNKLYDVFKELHTVTVNEFIHNVSDIVIQYEKNKISKIDFIDKLGEYLYSLLINSVFEIKETDLKCTNTSCDFYDNDDSQSLRFFVSDLYNQNSFSILKIKTFISLLGNDIDMKKIDFIVDFVYFNEEIINPNIFKMIEIIKENFNSLEIINLNKKIKNIFKIKYPLEVK